jgi:hypothetical protein
MTATVTEIQGGMVTIRSHRLAGRPLAVSGKRFGKPFCSFWR